MIGFEPTASSSRTKRAHTPKKTAKIIRHVLDEYIEKLMKLNSRKIVLVITAY